MEHSPGTRKIIKGKIKGMVGTKQYNNAAIGVCKHVIKQFCTSLNKIFSILYLNVVGSRIYY